MKIHLILLGGISNEATFKLVTIITPILTNSDRLHHDRCIY